MPVDVLEVVLARREFASPGEAFLVSSNNLAGEDSTKGGDGNFVPFWDSSVDVSSFSFDLAQSECFSSPLACNFGPPTGEASAAILCTSALPSPSVK